MLDHDAEISIDKFWVVLILPVTRKTLPERSGISVFGSNLLPVMAPVILLKVDIFAFNIVCEKCLVVVSLERPRS